MIYIQSNGTVHPELPTEHWISPTQTVHLTEADAKFYGYFTLHEFFNLEIEKILARTAHSLGYETALSARSYAVTPNQFQQESAQFIRYCGGVWAYAAQEAEKIKLGQRKVPSVVELEEELPTFNDFSER